MEKLGDISYLSIIEISIQPTMPSWKQKYESIKVALDEKVHGTSELIKELSVTTLRSSGDDARAFSIALADLRGTVANSLAGIYAEHSDFSLLSTTSPPRTTTGVIKLACEIIDSLSDRVRILHIEKEMLNETINEMADREQTLCSGVKDTLDIAAQLIPEDEYIEPIVEEYKVRGNIYRREKGSGWVLASQIGQVASDNAAIAEESPRRNSSKGKRYKDKQDDQYNVEGIPNVINSIVSTVPVDASQHRSSSPVIGKHHVSQGVTVNMTNTAGTSNATSRKLLKPIHLIELRERNENKGMISKPTSSGVPTGKGAVKRKALNPKTRIPETNEGLNI
jgi:hypothetical protein